MQKSVSIGPETIVLATITVGDLEAIDLTGKTGRKFNIGMIAASVLASGDKEHGTEAWVRRQLAFNPEGGESDFQKLLDACNEVNGFKPAVLEKNAPAPVAPAAAQAE